MTDMCQALGCLPREGGLLDQDGYHVYLMRAVLIVRGEQQEMERKKQEAEQKRMGRR